MQAQNIKHDRINQSINAEFALTSGKILTINVGWFNNGGERWTFDVLINLMNRQDFDYQTSHFSVSELKDSLEYLETSATPKEIQSIVNFIIKKKTQLKPENSAHNNYYGV